MIIIIMSLTYQIVKYNHLFNQDRRIKSYEVGDRVKVSDFFHSRSYSTVESNTVLL
jgi:hypothetical protein